MCYERRDRERAREREKENCGGAEGAGVLPCHKHLSGNVCAHNKKPRSFDLTPQLSNPPTQERSHGGTKAQTLAQGAPSEHGVLDMSGQVRVGYLQSRMLLFLQTFRNVLM